VSGKQGVSSVQHFSCGGNMHMLYMLQELIRKCVYKSKEWKNRSYKSNIITLKVRYVLALSGTWAQLEIIVNKSSTKILYRNMTYQILLKKLRKQEFQNVKEREELSYGRLNKNLDCGWS